MAEKDKDTGRLLASEEDPLLGDVDEEAAELEDERVKRECERLFHPEKFEVQELTTSVLTTEAANLDEGFQFYGQRHSESAPNMGLAYVPFGSAVGLPPPSTASIKLEEGPGEDEDRRVVTFEDPESGEQVPARPPQLQRANSTNEPVRDSSHMIRRASTASGPLEALSSVGSHKEELYPHYHNVMSRHKLQHSTSLVEPRGEKSGRKHKIIRDDTVTHMPTIQDDVEEAVSMKSSLPSGSEREKSATPSDVMVKVSRVRTISEVSKATSKESPEKAMSEEAIERGHEGDEEEAEIDDLPSEHVKFMVGQSDEEIEKEKQHIRDMAQTPTKQKKLRKRRRKSQRHKKHAYFTEDELIMRRAKGSDLAMDSKASLISAPDEEELLENKDIEEMTYHRLDHLPGMSRHRIRSAKRKSSTDKLPSTYVSIRRSSHTQDTLEKKKDKEEHKVMMDSIYGVPTIKSVDHSPHNVFVEMDELIDNEWIEQSRWIKYEEAREEGAERWGRPHVSSLSFHSLLNLRLNLEKGAVLLDHEGKDLTNVLSSIVEELVTIGYLNEESAGEVLRVLLYRHKYVDAKSFKWSGLHRNPSYVSILDAAGGDYNPHDHINGFDSLARFPRSISKTETVPEHYQIKPVLLRDDKERRQSTVSQSQPEFSDMRKRVDTVDSTVVDMPSLEYRGSSASFHASASFAGDLSKLGKKPSIMMRVPEDTEGALTLVGALEMLSEPLTAFVRLAEGIIMPNALEIPLPVRFIFLLLTPKPSPSIDCHEVGRAFSTLMSNRKFHNVCYSIDERKELLSAINDFLDESVVLPPGDWDSKNMLSMSEIHELRARKRKKKMEIKSKVSETKEEQDDNLTYRDDPLQRAPYLFGGVFNDWRRRIKWYPSDITDGFNSQVFAAAIFIYFAGLSGAIAFGGLLGEKTKNLIGISETLVLSSVAGTVFALFSGMPLIITGVTGPLLLYDESLYRICQNNDIEYLPFRAWIGIWMVVIATIVAMFQGSLLVKCFTKFTKDIFAALVSLLYIFEALKKLSKVFMSHPLATLHHYCDQAGFMVDYSPSSINGSFKNGSSAVVLAAPMEIVKQEPNTALLSLLLMFGTFFIAYVLRIVRNSHYFGRTVRRALGDFGVPIAIVIMVAVDFFIEDTFTEKLKVPEGFQVTLPDKRSWFINPLGEESPLAVWLVFGAILPAALLYLLLYMETHICELIMMEKTNKKGVGLHWDIVLLCSINCLSSVMGGPFICAATVRAVAHVSALTVMSTTHAPGESPRVVEVKDQRMSALFVSVLIGLSVFLSPLLKHIPYAVLFGVFLYMGVSSVNGIQLFDRLLLILKPVKHHPTINYVRRVRAWKMHLYTFLQLAGLVLLWVVKSSVLALAFPFFVVAMIPFRMSLRYIFTPRELEALDGKNAGQTIKDDDPDFYEQGIGA